MDIFFHPSKKILFGLYLLMVIVLSHSPIWADNSKKGILKHKLMEISSLNTQITEKTSQAILIRDELRAKKREFIDEIRHEKNARKINTYEKAKQVPRIEFNLKLILRLNAYIDRLDQKILYFKMGKQKLEFYHRQAADEIKLIEILDDMEVRALINNVDQLIDLYGPEVKKPLMTAGNISLNPTAIIWNHIDSEKP